MFAFTNFTAAVPVQTDLRFKGFAEDPAAGDGWAVGIIPPQACPDRSMQDGRLDRPTAFVRALASVNEALDQLCEAEQALEQQLSDLRGYIGETSRPARSVNAD